MVRAALGRRPGGSLRSGPRAFHDYVPAISVLFATSLVMLPIVSNHGWWPNFGLLMLLAWRLLRADAWPAWVGAPLGFVNDLLTGTPLGLSVALWTAFLLAMDVIDRRTMWRDYWMEWALAALFITIAELAQWRVAAAGGAAVRLATIWPAILVSTLTFPFAGMIVSRLDRWRLGQ